MSRKEELLERVAAEWALLSRGPVWVGDAEDVPAVADEEPRRLSKSGVRMRRKRARDRSARMFWRHRLLRGGAYWPWIAHCSARQLMEGRAAVMAEEPWAATVFPERLWLVGVTAREVEKRDGWSVLKKALSIADCGE